MTQTEPKPTNSYYPIKSKYVRLEGPGSDKTQPVPDPRTQMPRPNGHNILLENYKVNIKYI